MKEGGYLVYKCRRCGGLDKSCHAHNALFVLIEIVNNGIFDPHGRGLIGPLTTDKTMHHCEDRNTGVADIIGIERDT